ncbi:MAG: YkgJ family cysteine cluster protein [Planctomycetaceae bacterium]|nr:YkgJ family cysteine cluster protein [Planctomycetaceae bacterium]
MLDSPTNDDVSNGLADRPELSILPVETCDGCGLCCQGIGSPVAIYASRPGLPDPHPSRPPDLPAELIREINDHFSGLFRGQEPQDACLWFDRATLRCRHYEYRPPICREYQLGGSECQRRRAEERARTDC